MGLSTTYTKAETLFLLQQIDKKVVGGYKGDLRISDPAPTEVGYYMLLEIGTYINLDSLNPVLNRLNFASFDGSNWSLISIAHLVNSEDLTVVSLEPPSGIPVDGQQWIQYEL